MLCTRENFESKRLERIILWFLAPLVPTPWTIWLSFLEKTEYSGGSRELKAAHDRTFTSLQSRVAAMLLFSGRFRILDRAADEHGNYLIDFYYNRGHTSAGNSFWKRGEDAISWVSYI